MDAICVNDLVKEFNGNEVLRGITLRIQQGEFYAIMGPNGSGKTTLTSIIAAVRSPTRGTVTVYEKSPKHSKRLIGYVPQENFSSPLLTGSENLEFFAEILRYPKNRADYLVNDLLAKFGLLQDAHKRVSMYSGGMRKRLEVATAFFPGAKLLVLDEPTTGLDPSARRTFFNLLRELKTEEMTILLVTHIGADAEMASKVGLMNKGALVAEGTPEQLKEKSGLENVITVETLSRSPQIIEVLERFSERFFEVETGYKIHCKNAEEIVSELVKNLDTVGVNVTRLEMAEPSLEDVFFRVTGEPVEEIPL